MKKVSILSAIMSFMIVFAGINVSAATPYVQSDTTLPFTRPQGETYQVKFTVHGTHADPKIAAGNGSVLQTRNLRKTKDSSGNDVYYFKVKATGEVGSSSAIYTTLPGQKAVSHFVMTVGKPTATSSANKTAPSTSLKIVQGAGTVGRGYTANLSIKGKPNTNYTLTVYYPSGPSKAAGIGTTKSDSAGVASWAWKVGTRTTPGTHHIVISGNGQSIETSFRTT